MRRALLVALSLLATLLVVPDMAYADDLTVTESVTGASATCTVPADVSSISCDLSDTAGDSHSVFILWHQGNSEKRFRNSNGSGNTTHYEEGRLEYPDGNRSLNWKVCVDVQFGRDSCSRVVDATPAPTGDSYEVTCQGVNLNNPPSASIPPDLQPYFKCYPTEGYPSVSNDCLRAISEQLLGLSAAGAGWVKAGKIALKHVPFVGWVATGVGVYSAIQDCR